MEMEELVSKGEKKIKSIENKNPFKKQNKPANKQKQLFQLKVARSGAHFLLRDIEELMKRSHMVQKGACLHIVLPCETNG